MKQRDCSFPILSPGTSLYLPLPVPTSNPMGPESDFPWPSQSISASIRLGLCLASPSNSPQVFVQMEHILCANILVTVCSASKPVLIFVNNCRVYDTNNTSYNEEKTFVCFLRMFICKHMYSLY
ncbi:hypothetical protein HJG60_009862 [Phyllostomus discolor]|uniref:Uncharacterized protein n=1 Tax=Phyllostomus discolor TaxID=89673 RepID=A0A834B9Q2_9CHIR|nr:hypothetical protein HJG60_009862 [Phyllostomus discolor]